MAQTFTVEYFRNRFPERYQRVGAMIEDYVCYQLSDQALSNKHNLSLYTINFFVKQYFGKPREPFIVDIKVDVPKQKPIPIKLTKLYREYLDTCEKVDQLRDAIEKFEKKL